jgi:acyl-homoserine-lactone acylase
VAHDGENYRALNAFKLLSKVKGLTLDGLISKGYDKYLAAYDDLFPYLFAAYDIAPDSVIREMYLNMRKEL